MKLNVVFGKSLNTFLNGPCSLLKDKDFIKQMEQEMAEGFIIIIINRDLVILLFVIWNTTKELSCTLHTKNSNSVKVFVVVVDKKGECEITMSLYIPSVS